MTQDLRQFAPSTARNRDPILDVLKRVFPKEGLVLEIASGSGEHASYSAPALGNIHWQPTEYNADMLDSINAHALADGSTSVKPAIQLDVTIHPWPIPSADAVLNCNMIHISPWEVTLALMKGAGDVLSPGGVLMTYGPFKRNGAHTAPSNAQFDENLRSRNSEWGIRDLEKVIEVAGDNGLRFDELVEMPANNYSVIYRKD